MSDLLKVGIFAGAGYAVAQPQQKNALLVLGLGALLGYGAVQLAKAQTTRLQIDFQGQIKQTPQLPR